MAEPKIFAGPRIRRIRKAKGLTQTAMAEGLGISPSYLNLIERNQRPLTVQLILKLAGTYRIDPNEFAGEIGQVLPALREVFADPLLSGELPGEQELVDLAETAPNAAAAFIKLYRAYREQAGRLSDLSSLLAHEGSATAVAAARLPYDEARDVLEARPNFFPSLEEESEVFLRILDPADDLAAALKAWLKRELGIAVRPVPAETMPNWRRRYDRHSQRLFVSERLSPFDQLREIAMEVCLVRMQVAISAELVSLKLSSDEARRIARFELARYAAHALMMPYNAFLAAAQRARYDLDHLCGRFNVSFEQAATRLTTLARQDRSGIPFFLMEIDQAGHCLRRAGARGFPRSSFGGECPKLSVHAAFAQPGQFIAEAAIMPDDNAFICISRTAEGPRAAFGERPRRTALLLGCEIGFRDQIVYGATLPAVSTPRGASLQQVPIGPACRLCERAGCLSRAEPPLTRPLGLDEVVTGLSVFDSR